MPPRCCEPDYDSIFDDRAARRELRDYRREGTSGTTRRLIEAIKSEGVEGASVLDVGGGVGVIGAELLSSGAARLTDVDASQAYVAAARGEMQRRGLADRSTFLLGDFVRLAPEVEPADVVTLDRVICCYGDWQALVDASALRARRLYGIVIPVERWWMRIVVGIGNLGLRLFRQAFTFHLHPERGIDARIRSHGFTPIVHHRGLAWQTIVYRRSEAPRHG